MSSKVVSTDVDLWIAPRDRTSALRVLAAHGWHLKPQANSPRILAQHAEQLTNENWPVELDLHRAIPGFFADADVVFERAWQRRRVVEVGSVQTMTPPDGYAALIHILGALRDLRAHPERLQGALFDVERWACSAPARNATELIEAIAQTGSAEALAASGLDLVPPLLRGAPPAEVNESATAAWQARIALGVTPGAALAFHLRRADKSKAQKFALVARETLLSRDELERRYPNDKTSYARLKRRVWRLRRGFNAFVLNRCSRGS